MYISYPDSKYVMIFEFHEWKIYSKEVFFLDKFTAQCLQMRNKFISSRLEIQIQNKNKIIGKHVNQFSDLAFIRYMYSGINISEIRPTQVHSLSDPWMKYVQVTIASRLCIWVGCKTITHSNIFSKFSEWDSCILEVKEIVVWYLNLKEGHRKQIVLLIFCIIYFFEYIYRRSQTSTTVTPRCSCMDFWELSMYCRSLRFYQRS